MKLTIDNHNRDIICCPSKPDVTISSPIPFPTLGYTQEPPLWWLCAKGDHDVVKEGQWRDEKRASL
ncbi:PASTA domain-containing protein [Sesbania bispinosa]|nr:PASTA domain-containing protein [Sesbania bispinosa]